jgi:hypothetical protein
MKYSKEKIEEMRQHLADSEWEGLDDKSLREVLWHGCTGWANMDDEDIVKMYNELTGEEEAPDGCLEVYDDELLSKA